MTEIVLLDTGGGSSSGLVNIRAVFWFPVAQGQEVPLPDLPQSAWRDASPDQLAELRLGHVTEQVITFPFGISLDTGTIQKMVQIAYSDMAEAIAALPPKGKFYGQVFEDGSWK